MNAMLRLSLGLALALTMSTPLAGIVPGAEGEALAQDDARRVMKARQFDTDVDLSDEYAQRAMEKRLQSIDFLKELLSEPDVKGERKAEMMLRLADMYFQQGRYLYLREMAGFDQEYEKCFNNEACNPELMKPDNTESQEWQEKSIKLYQQILRNYPRYQRADEATYYLASALQDVGRRKEAVQYFTTLVKSYPDSGYVADSYVQIGEYYFDENNAYKALLAYKKATAYRDSDKYAFALYKLAWCYYNVGEFGKGIDTMKSVVSFSMAQTESGSAAKRMQLQEEALKDLVRFFADAGEMDEAYEYFNKLGKKELIQSMLKRLAGMYFEQGKFEQCIQTYRRLIAENPQSPDNPDYQHEIIQAYKKIGKKEQTLAEIDRMLKTYGKNSAWARANASDQDAIKGAQEKIEKDLRAVAVEYHNAAKKLGNNAVAKTTWALAYNAYKVYLQEFPDSSHAYEVRYAFGELLYKIKRFDEAYEQYMAVVKMDPKGQHSRFCAESAIFAADEMVKKEGGAAGTSGPTAMAKKDAQPLTQWEQNLVDACSQYATLFPEDKKVRNVIYKSAYLLYNKYHFERAADQFKLVIQMDPSSKEAEQAANLILDSFVFNEDWANLKKNSKFYYDQEGLGSAQFKKDVYNIYERSSFKLIEINFGNDEDYNKAADAFVAFYKEFPESEVAAQALNNASVYYHKVNRVQDAMEIRHILVEDPGFGDKTKYYYDQVAALGFDYETIADFSKAAHYYELLFSLHDEWFEELEEADEDDEGDKLAKAQELVADALYSAAVYRKAEGDWEKAVKNYQSFTSAFPEDKRVYDVKLAVARTYEEQELWAKAGNVYNAFYTKERDAGPDYTYFARLGYAEALLAQNQRAKADRVMVETIKLYQKEFSEGSDAGIATEFVAEMMFIQAQPAFDRFVAMEIKGAGSGAGRRTEDRAIERSLKDKAKALVELEQTYTEIINTGAGEWGLAAIVQLGKVYDNMGDSLANSAIPYYLTDDQREMYQMALEDRVYPQIEKAVGAYGIALDKSYNLTLYNENTAYAVRRLGELRPADFPGLEEELLEPRYTSQKVRNFDFETGL